MHKFGHFAYNRADYRVAPIASKLNLIIVNRLMLLCIFDEF